MDPHKDKVRKRLRRHRRVRKKVFGTPERPRLTVYRSLRHMYAQIVDDSTGRTLVAASTQAPDVREALGDLGAGNRAAAALVGRRLAEKALAHGIRAVVFDRSGYRYRGAGAKENQDAAARDHTRVAALAQAARDAGLAF